MTIALAIDRPAVTLFHGYDISRLLRDRVWVERYRAVASLGMQALCISHAGRQKLIESAGRHRRSTCSSRCGHRSLRVQPPSERWRRGPRRILMVARLVEKKGIDVALEAMRRLRRSWLDVELRMSATVRNARASRPDLASGTHQRVAARSARARADETRILAGHLYIQPSITAESGDQEGIPVSLMEAMAGGLPVYQHAPFGHPELVLDGQTGS